MITRLVAILLLLALSTLAFLTCTETGAYASLALLNKISQEQFSFQKIKGSLAQGLSIQQLDFKNKDYEVSGENIQIQLNALALAKGELHVQQLIAEQITMQKFSSAATPMTLPNPTKQNKKNTPKSAWHFPLDLRIDQLEAKTITFHHPLIKQNLLLSLQSTLVLNKKQTTATASLTISHEEPAGSPIKTQPIILGQLNFKGQPNNYLADLELSNDKINLHLQGRGNQNGIIINTIPSSAKNIIITANIQKLPFFNWQASIMGNNFDPATLSPSLPGKIAFTLIGLGDSKGNVIQLQKLTGTLRQKKIRGTMHIARNRHNFNLNSTLEWGLAKLFAQGGATTTWKLKWQLFFPNIADLFVNNSGRIDSKGNIYGDRDSPHLMTTIHANNLNLNNAQITQLRANINLDLSNQGIFKISANADNLYYNNYYFDHFVLKGNGNTNEHTLEANLKDQQHTFIMVLKGGYIDKIWQEKLLKMDLLSPVVGNWHLKEMVSLSLSADAVHIDPIIWQSKSANIYTALDWHRNHDYIAKLLIHHLPLSELRSLLPDENFLHNPQGNIEADIKINYGPKITKLSKKLKANNTASTFGLQGYLKLQNAAFEIPSYGLNFKNISLSAEANDRQLECTATAQSAEGILHFNGKTQFNDTDYSSNLKIQGDNFLVYNKPALFVYVSPDLTANIKNHQLNISGKILIPVASLKSVKSPHSYAKLPSDVVFVNDSDVENGIPTPPKKKQSLKISSKIQIILGEHFNFDLEGFTGRLIGKLDTVDNLEHPTSINGRLQVVDASYTLYGQALTVTNGWLHFINSPIDNPSVHIQAVKKFNAKNSTEAENLQSKTIVGINIEGNLKKPQTTLFSDPPGLSQKDILSMLMFERTTDQITNGSNNLDVLFKAASSLNFGGQNHNLSQLTAQLQHGLGLNELGIKSETTFNESSSSPTSENTSFVFGKFISSRLYLKYSVGLFEAINTFTVRYLLGPKFIVQGQTNQQGSGVDLIYSIQK